ncbi:MAG: hypothetical protein D6733_06635, partial [Methanobacteriota archaeon]
IFIYPRANIFLMTGKRLGLNSLVALMAAIALLPLASASSTIFYDNYGVAVGWTIGSGDDSFSCFKVGGSWDNRWCTTRPTPVKMLPLQQGSNYCGQALMQAFIPEMSQYSLRKELGKARSADTYWNDFYTVFDRHGVSYHWGEVTGDNTPVIVGGYMKNHVILVLEKINATDYAVFDPAIGLTFVPAADLESWSGLVIDEA